MTVFSGKMPKKNYTTEDLAAALSDINNKNMSIYKAAKLYKIPEQTLRDKAKNKYVKQAGPGKPTILTPTEEELLVKWVKKLAECGFPVSKQQLLFSVSKLVDELGRDNNFTNGVPGRHWYEGFLSRNPSISHRVAQPLTTARMGATEEKVRGWFRQIHEYLEKNHLLDILEDPTRIFNCDESAFFLCPKGQGVLTQKGVKTVYMTSGNDDKENLTLSLGAAASGKLMPIFALFPYKRMPQNILAKYPIDWAIGKSDNGWMTCQTFYEYITNVFYPFLVKESIKLPIILFLDGHSSHLSLALSEFCSEKGIILIALLPNSTHIMQPMDVAVFHPLKTSWKKKVHDWRMQNSGSRLKRDDFAPLLQQCIFTLKAETIQQGFKTCGLYPFNPEAPNYHRLVKTSASRSITDTVNNATDSSTSNVSTGDEFLRQFEERLGIAKVQSFQKCPNGVWTGDIRDENLFHFWRSLHQLPKNGAEVTCAERDSKLSIDAIAADNSLDASVELHMSDLLNMENDTYSEFTVQPNGTLISSIPKSRPVSTLTTETGTEIDLSVRNTENGIRVCEEIVNGPLSTPEKVPAIDATKSGFPTPFKNALLWPETPQTTQPKRNLKRITPTVAIASEFMEYQRRLEQAKKIKLEKSLVRQKTKKTNDKKDGQIKSTQKKAKPSLEDRENPSDIDSGTTKSIAVGDYVLIIYEDEKFPGVVTNILMEGPEKKYEVKTMQMTGSNWRWPDKVDMLVYDAADVLKKLEPPILLNSRGVYSFDSLHL